MRENFSLTIDLENNTLFVVSDIHSFYSELIASLKMAGYDKKNKSHILVVVGDVFDRGPDTVKLYKFLKKIPKSRRILIKGNHEDLYKELLSKDFPDIWDFTNHTVSTFCQIAGYKEECLEYTKNWWDGNVSPSTKESKIYWNQIREIVAHHEITSWIFSDEWINYAEIGDYIFTHAFIPVGLTEHGKLLKNHVYRLLKEDYFPISNWRESSDKEWYEARWENPWLFYLYDLFKLEEENGKHLVVGHWHTSDFWEHIGHHKDSTEHSIFYSPGIIAIDGGVWYKGNSYYGTRTLYHPQNVLVIKNGVCYDQTGEELKSCIVPIIETESA